MRHCHEISQCPKAVESRHLVPGCPRSNICKKPPLAYSPQGGELHNEDSMHMTPKGRSAFSCAAHKCKPLRCGKGVTKIFGNCHISKGVMVLKRRPIWSWGTTANTTHQPLCCAVQRDPNKTRIRSVEASRDKFDPGPSGTPSPAGSPPRPPRRRHVHGCPSLQPRSA